jgi:hypothetical protein
METKIAIQDISLDTQGLFFRKVGYLRNDVPSEIIYTDNTMEIRSKVSLYICGIDYFIIRTLLWTSSIL